MATYAFAGADRIVCAYATGGLGQLGVLDLRNDDLRQLDGTFLQGDVLLDGSARDTDLHRGVLITDATCGQRHRAGRARRNHEPISALVVCLDG